MLNVPPHTGWITQGLLVKPDAAFEVWLAIGKEQVESGLTETEYVNIFFNEESKSCTLISDTFINLLV